MSAGTDPGASPGPLWLVVAAVLAALAAFLGLEALARFVAAGVPLVSQTVLLKGVNDDPETLAALMRAFVEARLDEFAEARGLSRVDRDGLGHGAGRADALSGRCRCSHHRNCRT